MTERDDKAPDDIDRDYWLTEGYEGYVEGMRHDAGVPYITGRVPPKILEKFTREQLLQELDAAYYTYEGMLGTEARYRKEWEKPSLSVSKAKPAREDFDEFEEVLSGKIRQLRIDRGWSQEDLAEQLEEIGFKMHQTTIAKLESGKRPIRVSEVFALAFIFRLPMEALWSLPTPHEPVPLKRMREEFDRINAELRDAESDLRRTNLTIRELQDHKSELAREMNEAATTAPENRINANLELHLRKLGLPPTNEIAPDRFQSGHLIEYAAQRDRAARAILRVEEVSADVTSTDREELRQAAIESLHEAITDARYALERQWRSGRYAANNRVEVSAPNKETLEQVTRTRILQAQDDLKHATAAEERAYAEFDAVRSEMAKAHTQADREALQDRHEVAEQDYRAAMMRLKLVTDRLRELEGVDTTTPSPKA
ncbi:helix-turn-helix transcriptional regulator [Amycolatopsis sp. NPDC051371]|uniref:helix-turn-helix transcriptional regulator n=1 Tax=Amycolatopsis sp. NPDC051371 TaxID=3155800 RepID=UPI003425ED47